MDIYNKLLKELMSQGSQQKKYLCFAYTVGWFSSVITLETATESVELKAYIC